MLIAFLLLLTEAPAGERTESQTYEPVVIQIIDFENDITAFGNGDLHHAGLNLPPGSTGFIDPNLLQRGREVLDLDKINASYRLFQQGQKPPPIEISPTGVIYDGNSRAFAAGRMGQPIEYVVGREATGYGAVMDATEFFSRTGAGKPGFWAGFVGLLEEIGEGFGRFFKP